MAESLYAVYKYISYLVLCGVFLLLNLGQCQLKVIYVFLQFGTFVLQFPLLGRQLSIDLFLILSSLSHLLDFGLEVDFGFDQLVTPFLCISQAFSFLELEAKSKLGSKNEVFHNDNGVNHHYWFFGLNFYEPPSVCDSGGSTL